MPVCGGVLDVLVDGFPAMGVDVLGDKVFCGPGAKIIVGQLLGDGRQCGHQGVVCRGPIRQFFLRDGGNQSKHPGADFCAGLAAQSEVGIVDELCAAEIRQFACMRVHHPKGTGNVQTEIGGLMNDRFSQGGAIDRPAGNVAGQVVEGVEFVQCAECGALDGDGCCLTSRRDKFHDAS